MIRKQLSSLGLRAKGFTLIEVIVAIVLIAIVMAVMVFGFDQTVNRRKDTAVNQFADWLQASADIAVFQSSVLGIAEEGGRLSLLAFYQDDWYRFSSEDAFYPSEEIRVFWSEELVRAQESGLVDSDDLFPYIVIMPTGQILPEGKILITNKMDSDDIDASDIDDNLIAELKWDQDAKFELEWISNQ